MGQPNVPITFALPGKLDMIYGKLNEFLEKGNITLEAIQKKALDGTKKFLEDPTNGTINVSDWKLLVGK